MTLASLIERLEKAEGPDRDLDARIHLAVVGDDVWIDEAGVIAHWPKVHEYTRSLDAALALVERVLPDADWNVGRALDSFCWAEIAPGAGAQEHAPTPPLALLLALCRALQAKEEK